NTPSTPGDDDLSFDWQETSQEDTPGTAGDDDTFSFDWQDEPADEESSRQEEWKMQRPERLESAFEQSMEEAENAEFGDVESILDWMATPEDETPGDAAAGDEAPLDLPDWLQGMEIPEADESPSAESEEPLELDYEVDYSAGADEPDEDISWLENLAGTGSLRSDEEADERLNKLTTGSLGGADDSFDRLNELAQTGELEEEDDLARLGDLATGELSDESSASVSPFSEPEWDFEGFGEEDFEPLSQSPSEEKSSGIDWEATFNEEDFGEWEGLQPLQPAQPAEPEAPDQPAQGGLDTDAIFGDMTFDEADSEQPNEAMPFDAPDWLSGMELPEEAEEEEESLDDALSAFFASEAEEPEASPTDEDITPEEEPDWMMGLDVAPETDDQAAFFGEPAEESSLDDLLSELGGEGEEEESSLDDLLAELDDEQTAEPSSLDDLLAELDAADIEEEPSLEDDLPLLETDDFIEEEPSLEDDLPLLETDDFIEETEPAQAMPVQDDDDFFDDLLGGLDADDSTSEEAASAEPIAADVDWLRELDAEPDALEQDIAESDFLDADEWLASLGDTEEVYPVLDEEPESGEALDLDDDFLGEEEPIAAPAEEMDDIFAGLGGVEGEHQAPQEADFGGEDVPEWLREAASQRDSGTSAVAELRNQKDRSLDELDERLLDLRERGLELTTSDPEADTNLEKIAPFVPNAADALIPVKRGGTAQIITEPTLTPVEQQRADLLRGLVTATIGDGDEAAAERQRAARGRRGGLLRGYKVGRLLIAAVLLAMVAIPFLSSNYDLVDLPPTLFASGSQQEQAFLRIQSLMPEDPVLVAVEYGATGARELDTMTEAIFSHVFNKGAIPVLVSTDPLGLL
ncbi:MAG: hypothetical protein KC496_22055, partial [Anaerolineae bacterium]|nr:hypothetical protein [Anaerolineae bacterium]